MKKIVLALCLLSAVLLRPGQMQQWGLIYAGIGGDDFCYLAHSTAIAYGEWPSYKKESICRGEMPMASIGPGIIAAPLVTLFSIIDRARGAPIVEERRADNVVHSASAWGFILTTLAIFGITLQLFRLWLRQAGVGARAADWSVIFLVLLQGVPLFAYRRPIFSHSYELFACISLLVFLEAHRSREGLIRRWPLRSILLGGTICFFVATTRTNNLPLAVLWPAIYAFHSVRAPRSNKRAIIINYAGLAISFAFLYVLLKMIPTALAGGEKYSSMAAGFSPFSRPLSYWPERFFYMLFGADWGLVYSAPFLIVAFAAAFTLRYRDRKLHLALVATLSIDFYLAFMFGTNGGWYGYRYFLFVAAAVLAVPFGHLLDSLIAKSGGKALLLLGAVAILPTFSMLLFEGNDNQLTLKLIRIGSQQDYGNLTYQLEVWRTLLLAPKEFFLVLFKGVPAYFSYLIMNGLGLGPYLPSLMRERFAAADNELLIKVMSAILVPITAFVLSAKFARRASASPMPPNK